MKAGKRVYKLEKWERRKGDDVAAICISLPIFSFLLLLLLLLPQPAMTTVLGLHGR
jgi:hypothetical protein